MTDIVNPGAPAVVLNQDNMPAKVDLVIYRGDFVEIFVDLVDSEKDTSIPLEEMVPSAQLRTDYDSEIAASFDCSIVEKQAPENQDPEKQVRIYLSSTDSSGLESDSYIWDFQLTDSKDDSRTFFTGDVTVSPEVTVVQ